MENKPIIEINNVSYKFTDVPHAHPSVLENISLSVYAGEFVSLVGTSGSGKSTLLRIIAGLLSPSKGNVTGNYKKIAMVFQSFALFPWLSVLENTSFGLKMSGASRGSIEKIAREKLKEVGLSGMEHRYPHELSGGQKQRVSIARALTFSPDVLLMDEPFSSLDSITADILKKDILSLWEKYKMTIIMVNHLVPDAVEMSDSIYVLGNKPATIVYGEKLNGSRPRNPRDNTEFELVEKITEKIKSSGF